MDGAEDSARGQDPSCPDAGMLVELARGSLAPGPRDEVLAHVRACAECGEVLRLWTGQDVPPPSASSAASAEGAASGLNSPPAPGDVLAGKYRVERVLGLGGMGVVVAATHLQLGRTVAIKLMLPQVAGSAEVAARFVQEARAAAELQSEHVARVLDVGELDDGAPFMVMEFLRGQDLSRVVRAGAPLPVVDVAGYVLQACEALAEAHAVGIVHRDLKPANLFLTTRADGSPLVKVLDFGISKLVRAQRPRGAALTKSRTVMGTPLYMSPEQLRSTRSVGPATDLWSLGCILYELLTGRLAFQAESAEALGALIATGPAPRVREARPDVPAEIDEIIVRCLEKDPADRLGSVAELARRLGPFAPADLAPLVGRIDRISQRGERVAGQLPFADTQASERPPALGRGTAGSFASSNHSASRRGLRRPWLPLLAGAAIVAAGLLAIYARPSDRRPDAAPTATVAPANAATTGGSRPDGVPAAVEVTEPAPSSATPAYDGPATLTSASGGAARSADPPRVKVARPSGPVGRSSATASGSPAPIDPTTHALQDRK